MGVEVIGFEVTNTVIWLGEMLLDEGGICIREWTGLFMPGLGFEDVKTELVDTAEVWTEVRGLGLLFTVVVLRFERVVACGFTFTFGLMQRVDAGFELDVELG